MQDTEWVGVAEAARLLGCSPDTVRRRARNGQLPARRRITPTGYAWEVVRPLHTEMHGDADMPAGHTAEALPPQSTLGPFSGDSVAVVQVMDRLHLATLESTAATMTVARELRHLRLLAMVAVAILAVIAVALVVMLTR